MSEKLTRQVDDDLQLLEQRIDELVSAVKNLKQENLSLQDQQQLLMAERQALDEKTKLAKVRVEAMIERLKNMEMDS